MVYKIDRYLNYCLYASAVIRDVARSKGCKTRQSLANHNHSLTLRLNLIILFTNVQSKNIYTYIKVQ